MRLLIVALFVLSLKAYSAAASASARLSEQQAKQLEQARKSVWIINDNHGINGTAFFVSPRHVVTNWHIINQSAGLASFSLQREGRERKLSVQRLVSVSVLHDLALLEVEKGSMSHLTVRKDLISSEERLVLLGYSKGVFRYVLKTGPLHNFNGHLFTSFSVNSTDLKGKSGGPVLDANNKVVGVLAQSIHNYMKMIKGSVLRKFIAGDIGLSCAGRDPKACIKEEINKLQKQSEGGDQAAQSQLAMMYPFGLGVQQDVSSALKWFRRSAEQGSAFAQYMLGGMYEDEDEQNLSSALKWYRRSAEQGYAPAQYDLGMMHYMYRERVRQTLSSALKWFRRSARQGYIPAQYMLGEMYYKGEGVRQNLSSALKWFRRSAEQGDASAQYMLGEMYYKGEGVRQNLSSAFHWYRRSAGQDHISAQYILGKMYYEGEGVQKDFPSSLRWLRLSAKQGDASAQYMLREIYKEGEKEDFSFFVDWLRHFGEQDNIISAQIKKKALGEQGGDHSSSGCHKTFE